MIHKKPKHILEKFFESNSDWQEGYESFKNLLGHPTGWLVLTSDEYSEKIKSLDQGHFHSNGNKKSLPEEEILYPYAIELARNAVFRYPFREKVGTAGDSYTFFPLMHVGQIKGFFVLSFSSKNPHRHKYRPIFWAFSSYLQNLVQMAYKDYELQHVYETVHPRALALSTLHSLHRVISSSLRLGDLLPRIARLCAQILKARGCSIMLADPSGRYLIPKVILGDYAKHKKTIRHRFGHGIEGKVALNCEFHKSSRCVAVPLIEDDLVGVISVCNKIDNSPFADTDMEILRTLSEQAVVAIKNAQLFEESEELTLGSIKSINELLNLSLNVEHTHHQIIGDLTLEIGKEMHLHGDELTHIYRATYLLDTGHIATPKDILEKRSQLTREEFEKIKLHPESGANVLRKIPSLRPLIPIILHHHERWDGKGYPDGLKGGEIPLGARIVAVVDSYSAMISKRPYRKKMTPEEAVEEIKRHSGTQFDPEIVDVFVKVMERRMLENRAA
ncbi:MAG: HD domain-containing protein [Candidatus Omnitrophica bacterium]|nr:HD domain-containing protein [Candidatus Omnitrophota bacterium]